MVWDSYRCKKFSSQRQRSRHNGKEADVIQTATEIAETLTGSQTCEVSLLQKFQMSVQLSEPYAALVQFPLSTTETK